MRFKSKNIVLCLIFILVLSLHKPLFAQDEGEPVMKTLTFYSVGGAATGSILGLLYFLTDPMAPARKGDPKPEIYSGFGIGAIAGVIFGITQLNKQAIQPGMEIDEFNEFEGNVQNQVTGPEKDIFYATHPGLQSEMQVTILSLQYKF